MLIELRRQESEQYGQRRDARGRLVIARKEMKKGSEERREWNRRAENKNEEHRANSEEAGIFSTCENAKRPSVSGWPFHLNLVGTTGFEPATSATPLQRATKLRHVPTVSGRASPSRRDVMYRIDLKKKSRNLTFLYLHRDLVSQ